MSPDPIIGGIADIDAFDNPFLGYANNSEAGIAAPDPVPGRLPDRQEVC